MKRIKALKLELEAALDEEKILWNLRQELKKEFGKDVKAKFQNESEDSEEERE